MGLLFAAAMQWGLGEWAGEGQGRGAQRAERGHLGGPRLGRGWKAFLASVLLVVLIPRTAAAQASGYWLGKVAFTFRSLRSAHARHAWGRSCTLDLPPPRACTELMLPPASFNTSRNITLL